MATYEEYLEHAKSKNFQPVKEGTFNSLSKAGFDPIKNTFEKEQIRKMGDALDKAGAQPSRPDMFPKTIAAFEEMAKSDAERAERRAARGAAKSLDEFNAKAASKTGGGGGGGGGGAGIPKVGPKKPLEMKSGGKVSSASKRADGCAIRGKTRA